MQTVLEKTHLAQDPLGPSVRTAGISGCRPVSCVSIHSCRHRNQGAPSQGGLDHGPWVRNDLGQGT